MAETVPRPEAHGEYQHYTQGHDPAGLNGHHHHGYAGRAEGNDYGIPPPKHQSTVSQVYNPGFFKFANPGPLGLISFALTTLVLGFYQCGVGLPNSNAFGNVGPDQAVLGLALFMGGLAQLIAGIMEFRVGNTFGTTVHISYGAFWLAFAMLLIPGLDIRGAYGNDARAFSVHIGIFLIAWCFLTIIFFVGALRTNIAILSVFGFLILAFFFLALAQFIQVTHPTNAVRVNRVGGAFAVIDALCAFYAGAAGIMTPATTMVRLPLGEFSRSNKATAEKSAA